MEAYPWASSSLGYFSRAATSCQPLTSGVSMRSETLRPDDVVSDAMSSATFSCKVLQSPRHSSVKPNRAQCISSFCSAGTKTSAPSNASDFDHPAARSNDTMATCPPSRSTVTLVSMGIWDSIDVGDDVVSGLAARSAVERVLSDSGASAGGSWGASLSVVGWLLQD